MKQTKEPLSSHSHWVYRQKQIGNKKNFFYLLYNNHGKIFGVGSLVSQIFRVFEAFQILTRPIFDVNKFKDIFSTFK